MKIKKTFSYSYIPDSYIFENINSGAIYYMAPEQLLEMITNTTMINGTVTGNFTIIKHASHYSLKWLSEI